MIDLIFEHEYLQRAVFAGLLASIACGIIGTFVVVNRISFISGGISHTAFGGVGMAYYFGFNPIIGASIFAVLSSFFIGILIPRTKLRADSMIGIIWAVGMAIGLFFINITDNYTPDLMSYLFGDILLVSEPDIIIMIILNAIILLMTTIFFRKFQIISFDKEFAFLIGLRVNMLFILMYALIALTVVVLIRVVGIILVIALLTMPATISNMYSNKLKNIMILSVILGIIFSISGLWLSYTFKRIPSGATIIFTGALAFIISGAARLIIKKFKKA